MALKKPDPEFIYAARYSDGSIGLTIPERVVKGMGADRWIVTQTGNGYWLLTPNPGGAEGSLRTDGTRDFRWRTHNVTAKPFGKTRVQEFSAAADGKSWIVKLPEERVGLRKKTSLGKSRVFVPKTSGPAEIDLTGVPLRELVREINRRKRESAADMVFSVGDDDTLRVTVEYGG